MYCWFGVFVAILGVMSHFRIFFLNEKNKKMRKFLAFKTYVTLLEFENLYFYSILVIYFIY